MHNENYYLIHDPGHGWLKVPMQDLADLGLANKISCCSYVKGNYAYLEEDCDMAVFLAAFIQEHGYKPRYVSRYIDDPYSKDNPRNFKSYPMSEKYDDQAWKQASIFLSDWLAKEKQA